MRFDSWERSVTSGILITTYTFMAYASWFLRLGLWLLTVWRYSSVLRVWYCGHNIERWAKAALIPLKWTYSTALTITSLSQTCQCWSLSSQKTKYLLFLFGSYLSSCWPTTIFFWFIVQVLRIWSYPLVTLLQNSSITFFLRFRPNTNSNKLRFPKATRKASRTCIPFTN